MAKLFFDYGAMGAQKSANLVLAAHNYESAGSSVIITKPAKDTKGDDMVVSRAGLARRVDFLSTPDLDIKEKTLQIKRERAGKVIGALLVDEAQFLEPVQVDQLFELVVVHGLPVMTYGLRTDFRTQLFPGSERLMALAHEIRHIPTMCGSGDGCEKRAHFNARQVNGEYVAEGSQVAIDGEGNVTYVALCGGHYLEHVGPLPTLEPVDVK